MKVNNSIKIWTKNELLHVTKGSDITKKFLKGKIISGISIDSRTIKKNDLFVALIGKNHDGHNYIQTAINKGASGIIVSKKSYADEFNGLLVKNTKLALRKLAEHGRNRFKGKVIAVTGSNGKTTTKSMISEILGFFGKTHSTFQNNNNFLGVSLTLSRLDKNIKYCVLELGINHKNEMENLTRLAKPNIVMITNISSSHIENFDSEEEIAQAKSKIFQGLIEPSCIILNSDDHWYEYLKSKGLKFTKNIFSFGENINSQLQINKIISKSFGTQIEINHKKLFLKNLPIHQSINLCGLIMIIKLLKLNEQKALSKIRNLKPIPGRGNNFKIYLGKTNNIYATIIDDSYNANPSSMIASLKYIYQISKTFKNPNIVLVLGDMLELGEKAKKFHLQLIPEIKKLRPRCIMTVGNLSMEISRSLSNTFVCKAFLCVSELRESFFSVIKPKDIVLIKGSNGVGLFDFCKHLNKNIEKKR